jgi:predicted transcriptional regulator
MSSRIKITLSDDIGARLDELAAASGQPVARVAGQMVRDGLGKLAASARERKRASGRADDHSGAVA